MCVCGNVWFRWVRYNIPVLNSSCKQETFKKNGRPSDYYMFDNSPVRNELSLPFGLSLGIE